MKQLVVYLIAILLLLAESARAEKPDESSLQNLLIGSWLSRFKSDDAIFYALESYSQDGTAEYRIRERGKNDDLVKWASRYWIEGNCIHDEVIESSDLEFAAVGEKDRECVDETALGGKKLRKTSKDDQSMWAIRVSEDPNETQCLKSPTPPLCKRSFFLLTPGARELKNKQRLKAPAISMTIHGDDWAGYIQESKSASSANVIMLADGTNFVLFTHGPQYGKTLDLLFSEGVAVIEKVSKGFSKNQVKNDRIKLSSGEWMKTRRLCGALPTGVRICVFSGVQEGANLIFTATYAEGNKEINDIIRSIALAQ